MPTSNSQDQSTSPSSGNQPEPPAPAFQRQVFVSEETWNREIRANDTDWATDEEVTQAMDDLAEAEGVEPTRPWLTIGLIGANVLLFGAAVGTGVSPTTPDIPSLSAWGANVGPAVIGGQWWRLATAMFLHIGAVHILFNMAVLWNIGGFVERLLGRMGLGVVYLVAGLGASLTSILWNPDVVSAGASGAIFGLYGALLGYFLIEPKCVPPPVRARLALGAVFFVLYNMAYAVNAQGIDVGAHLGGLGTGFVCSLFLAVPATKEGMLRRPRLNIAVLVVGLVLAGALATLLPKLSGDTGQLVLAGKAETKALAVFEASAAKVRKGTFTDAQFAESIEGEVVPGLRQCRVRLDALLGVPRFSTEKLQAMVKLTKAQEGSYALMAHALKTGNQSEAAQALKARAEALGEFRAEMSALNP